MPIINVRALWLLACAALALGVSAHPALAVTFEVTPRDAASASLPLPPAMVAGEVDLGAGAGEPRPTVPVASTVATVVATASVETAPATTPVTGVAVVVPTDGTVVAPTRGTPPAPAQMPSGGAVAGGAPGVPQSGWGSGLPGDTTDKGPGFTGSTKVQETDWQLKGNTARSTHTPNGSDREDGTLAYDALQQHGIHVRGQISFRRTDDTEVRQDGNPFRLEGQFFELGRAHDFLLRAGDVTPQLTPYSFTKSGTGFWFLKNYEDKNSITQFQTFASQTNREKDPGAFQRETVGARAARIWSLDGGLDHVGLGAQAVRTHDFLESISTTSAAMTNGFPFDKVLSTNAFYDDHRGFHAEGELAHSNAELDMAGGTQTQRQGNAQHESMGYTRSGKNITIEHERIDPTYDAVDASAGLDLDRLGVIGTVPLSPKLTAVASAQRLYNDIRDLTHRTSFVRTYNAGLTSVPFAGSKDRYLGGLNVGLELSFNKNTSSDGTSDRFDRDVTWSVSDHIRRLTASYQLKTSTNTDYIGLANSRTPNHSSYQLSYDIPGGRNNYWKLSPFYNLGHDHDRNVLSGIVDLSNELSLGVNGNYGPRSQFSVRRDERVQRLFAASRMSLATVWTGQWSYQLNPKHDTKAELQYLNNSALDSAMAGLGEQKVLLSLSRGW